GRSSRPSSGSPTRFARAWPTERAGGSGDGRGRGRQARRDPGERAEVAQHALGVGRLEEDVRRGLAGQTAAQLAGADERLHARRGFVVEKLRPIERATTPVVTQIAADQERARRV